MEDLQELRKQIDQIDQEMVRLFEARMDVCRQVAEYKIANGKKVLDRSRELEKLDTLGGMAHNDFNRHGIRELFQQIMAMSRKLQYQLLEKEGVSGSLPFTRIDHIDRKHCRVVYQGVEGAYQHQAALEYFGKDVNVFHMDTWKGCMEAIKEGMADYAVLPIENSSAGEVNDIYDLLEEYENYIVGEQIIKIQHALLGVPGTKLEDIRTVFSHPQALMQCAGYLNRHPQWKQISLSNTAVAAEKAAQDGDKSQAAIAGEITAKLYGLEILEMPVNDCRFNSTRFIIVTNRKMYEKDARKVSICFELPHVSGSLYNILSHIIYNDLNMCKIESRPIPERNWEYHFFVDFEGNLDDSAVKNAIRGIAEEAVNFKILGNY
ncbi:chorismate mutase [Lachnoclostridium sp. An196]|uniref:prephenate dehydratase n=1 Tax=Lachnoclostridium sp. An196 TaxID=1965583 RepID=UPI000B3682BA|nr:prephenate dehydratase [Lachnoclostridium sp. An196]OUP22484.1 chorismate mutase [Lachnoclostridium sp. An196]